MVTPLHVASLKGHLEVVKYLIKHGADIHAKDKFDKMPFHNACSKGHVEVAEYLISCGTDINTFYKITVPEVKIQINALQEACREGYFGIVKCLITNNAIIDSKKGSFGAYTLLCSVYYL